MNAVPTFIEPEDDGFVLVEPQHERRKPPRNWRLRPIGEMLEQPQPTRWLVRGILEQAVLAVLFGPSGHGKSFVADDIAASVASGTPWHGHAVSAGPVVILAGEGHAGIAKRFLAWSQHHEIDLRDKPLTVSTSAIDLSAHHEIIADTITAACGDVNPTLIVVDTLARHLRPGANENSGEDMGPLIAAADTLRQRFDCTVLLIHHVGHLAQDRERGHSSLRGALDWSYGVTAKGGREHKKILVTCAKAKDQEPPEPMQFALERIELPWHGDDGKPEASCVLKPLDRAEASIAGHAEKLAAQAAIAADAEIVLAALKAAIAAGYSVTTATEHSATAWHTLANFPELGVLRQRNAKMRTHAALAHLQRDGRIVREGYETAQRKPRERWMVKS
jgi:hypothetical protein